MTDKFKFLYVITAILVVVWLFILPWYNLPAYLEVIVNVVAIVYFAIIINYVKNHKKQFFK